MTGTIPTPAVFAQHRRAHAAREMLTRAATVHVVADELLAYDLDDMTVEDAARIADECRKARAALSAAEEFLAKHVAHVWQGKWTDQLTVDGVGRVQPYRTYNDRWDHDEIVDQVVAAHMEETGGEVPDPMTVVRWLLSAAHVDYWRGGKLKELGVDVDDVRHREYGVPRLRIKSGSDHMVGDTVGES